MKFDHRHVVLAVLVTFVAACGGGTGGSTSLPPADPVGPTGPTGPTGPVAPTGGDPVLAGIALPSEVSALPTNGAPAPASRAGLRLGASAVVSLPADSDYAKAQTFKFVSERSLSQFDVLNTVFNALAQTHYDDPAVLNQGAYSAMVTWQEKSEQGQEQKQLLKWVVESTRASATEPNVVKAWFTQPRKGEPFTIQAKVVIDTAPTQNTDGSYTDYGVWTMSVKMLEGIPWHFVASASRDAQGRAVIKMEQAESGPGGAPLLTQGILVKSAQAGSGKVTYPDWEGCRSPDCVPAMVQVSYVYDAENVTLKKGDAAATTKSRHSFVDIVNRYGLFDAATGNDVSKSKQFGFPIRATVGGVETFGYYGAWQGRHQIWGDGSSSVDPGVNVQRADVPPGTTGASYTTSPVYKGILVKRSYAPAMLADLTGLAVETWDNVNMQVTFDGTKWCTNPLKGDPQPPPPGSPPGTPGTPPTATCGVDSGIVTDFSTWQLDPNDNRRNVMIGTWNMVTQTQINFVYEANGPAGPGFYEATMSPSTPHPTRTGTTPYVFASGAQLWVNIGGPVYISYDGLGWVKKTVAAFDNQTWTATFDPQGDVPYVLQSGREYYFNNSGTNYVVKVDNSITSVQLEIQSVANPMNASTFVPDGTTFSQQWCGQGACSTYSFVTDAGSSNFMKLVYSTVGASDSGKVAGAVVASGMWGLTATIAGQTVQFNWDYPMDNQMGGVQQFLKNASGAYVMLDDPIRLDAVDLTNASGLTRSFLLQFDGNWMQGLPNAFDDLRKAGFEVNDTIKQKVFSVPTGQVVGPYVVKQLQISEYMSLSSAAALPLTEALAINLNDVTAYVANGMGAIPSPAPLKYSEGNPVTP